MIISPFTPFDFSKRRDDGGIPSRYRQTFAPTDHILVQMIAARGEALPAWFLRTEQRLERLTFNKWHISDDIDVVFTVLTGLTPYDNYYLHSAVASSNVFRVTDNEEELKYTSLIQYSMRDNRDRTDAAFVIDGQRYFFDFRVPGGFKDNGWSFGVNNTQFLAEDEDIVELYARESTQKVFTLGTQCGVPIWFGEMLNRALCCHYFYIDGERYARKDSSTPEKQQLMDGLNSFVFTQNVQRVVNLDPNIENNNRISMRRDEGNGASDWHNVNIDSTIYNIINSLS